MNDQEIRTAVRRSGLDCDGGFRNELEALLTDELAGRPTVRLSSTPPTQRRNPALRWGIVGLAAASVVGVVVVNRSDTLVIVPSDSTVEPQTTITSPITTPVTSPVTSPVTVATVPTTEAPAASIETVPTPLVSVVASGETAIVSVDSPKVALVPELITDLPVGLQFEFESDGTLLGFDADTVEAYTVDGVKLWSMPVPTKPNLTPSSVAVGPDQVVYVAYGSDQVDGASGQTYPVFSVGAIPLAGDRAGTVVREWATNWSCTDVFPPPGVPEDGFCGNLVLRRDGFALSDAKTAPFVDATGADSGVLLDVPPPMNVAWEYASGPVQHVEFSDGDHSWAIDVRDPSISEAGVVDYAGIEPDGSALVLLEFVPPGAETRLDSPGAALVGRADGTIEQFALPADSEFPLQSSYFVGSHSIASIDGVLYAIAGTGSYQLVRLVPAGQ